MTNLRLIELTQAQRDRLAFVELRLRFMGEVRRQDLITRFGIQVAAATRDIGLYKDLASHNMEYDPKGKSYIPTDWFRPLFNFPAGRVLTWISQGYGDSEPSATKGPLTYEGTDLSDRIDLELLSVLTRAIHRKAVAEVSYRSLSSGLTTREIVPFAIAYNGLRWHLRAFDRRSNEFRNFAIGRVASAQLTASSANSNETPDKDIQWNRITELELVPHPANVQHPDTVESEYGMQNGVLRVQSRAAMAAYLLRRWSVDCTEDHSLKGGEYQLWLRNRQALYGITNLMLAPGYIEPSK